MKLWQTLLNKALSKGGKEKQRERTQVHARKAKPKSGHKGAKEQIMFLVCWPCIKAGILCWESLYSIVASADFAPYQLGGQMIHLNLVVRNSRSSFDILFSLPAPRMCTQPNWLHHQSITTQLNMKILSPKMVMAPIVHKNKNVISSKCDNVIESIQIHMPWRVLFFFFGLKFCTNVKNKYEKRIFGHICFWEKNH
jgi:hypothetical protein